MAPDNVCSLCVGEQKLIWKRWWARRKPVGMFKASMMRQQGARHYIVPAAYRKGCVFHEDEKSSPVQAGTRCPLLAPAKSESQRDSEARTRVLPCNPSRGILRTAAQKLKILTEKISPSCTEQYLFATCSYDVPKIFCDENSAETMSLYSNAPAEHSALRFCKCHSSHLFVLALDEPMHSTYNIT
jgi:hypothetical protein